MLLSKNTGYDKQENQLKNKILRFIIVIYYKLIW